MASGGGGGPGPSRRGTALVTATAVGAAALLGMVGVAVDAVADRSLGDGPRVAAGSGPRLVFRGQPVSPFRLLPVPDPTTTSPPSPTVADLTSVLPALPPGATPLAGDDGPADIAQRARSAADPTAAANALSAAGYTRGYDRGWRVAKTAEVSSFHLSEFAADGPASDYSAGNVSKLAGLGTTVPSTTVRGATAVVYVETLPSGQQVSAGRLAVRRGRLVLYVQLYRGRGTVALADVEALARTATDKIDAALPGLPS